MCCQQLDQLAAACPALQEPLLDTSLGHTITVKATLRVIRQLSSCIALGLALSPPPGGGGQCSALHVQQPWLHERVRAVGAGISVGAQLHMRGGAVT